MSILNYFKIKTKANHPAELPDPNGPLSAAVPSSTIAAVNKRVSSTMEKSASTDKSRGPYLHLTDEQKYCVGKRASEFGVTNTMRYYLKTFPDLPPLKETSVRRFKNEYERAIKEQLKSGESSGSSVKALSTKPMGRPLLIGEEADRQVRDYVRFLRDSGSAVDTSVVIATGESVLASIDANLLKTCPLTKDWAKSLLTRMGMVKRKVSSKAKIDVERFAIIKEAFLLDVKNVVELDEIPPQLIINWDQTAIYYVPVGSWTMELEGAKRVEIAGKDDKRQITAVFAGSMAGDFLPIQLVYKGKTPRCLPNVESVPEGWHLTYSPSHWSNEQTMRDYIQKIVVPYIEKIRQTSKVADNYPALLLFDNFKAQCTQELLTLLDDNFINVLLIPPNCTDRLQPMDISVNKPAKDFLRGEFKSWYAKQVCSQFRGESEKAPIDMRLSVVKPLGFEWMKKLYDYIKSRPHLVSNGFKDIHDYLKQ